MKTAAIITATVIVTVLALLPYDKIFWKGPWIVIDRGTVVEVQFDERQRFMESPHTRVFFVDEATYLIARRRMYSVEGWITEIEEGDVVEILQREHGSTRLAIREVESE